MDFQTEPLTIIETHLKINENQGKSMSGEGWKEMTDL